MTGRSSSEDGASRTSPPSPKHPKDDRLPPYSPGGVPEANVDEKQSPDRTKPAYPPKRRP